MGKRIRVLMAKPGWDVHDLGAKFISRACRDAGMEVIFTGVHQTAEQIVAAAVQEDVDVIGVSIMGGLYLVIMEEIMRLLKEEGMADKFMILVGGLIPKEDIPKLKEMGVTEVFLPATPWEKVPQFIEQHLPG